MIQLPVPAPPTPLEEVIQILAEGLGELVIRGCKPDRQTQECPRSRDWAPNATRKLRPL